MSGKAAHVEFIDDGLVQGMVERLVAFPVIAVIGHHQAAHRMVAVVTRPAGALALPQFIGNRTNPGIEQGLVLVKAETTGARFIWAIHAPRIDGAGR